MQGAVGVGGVAGGAQWAGSVPQRTIVISVHLLGLHVTPGQAIRSGVVVVGRRRRELRWFGTRRRDVFVVCGLAVDGSVLGGRVRARVLRGACRAGRGRVWRRREHQRVLTRLRHGAEGRVSDQHQKSASSGHQWN